MCAAGQLNDAELEVQTLQATLEEARGQAAQLDSQLAAERDQMAAAMAAERQQLTAAVQERDASAARMEGDAESLRCAQCTRDPKYWWSVPG